MAAVVTTPAVLPLLFPLEKQDAVGFADLEILQDTNQYDENQRDNPNINRSQPVPIMTEGSERQTSPKEAKLFEKDNRYSDDESSIFSEEAYIRVARSPALPSASSAQSRHFEKLVALRAPHRAENTARPGSPTKHAQLQGILHSQQRSTHAKIGVGLQNRDTSSFPESAWSDIPRSTEQPGPVVNRSIAESSGERDDEEEEGIRSFPERNVDVKSSWDGTEDDDVNASQYAGQLEIRRITEHWTRMRDSRDAVKQTFDRIKTERDKLLDLRQKRDTAYRALEMAILSNLQRPPDLDRLCKASREASLNCQQAEMHLDGLIDELEEGEIDLEIQERRFFTAVAHSETSVEVDGSDTESRPSSRTSLRGIPADRPEDIHPLYAELQDSLGELQLAREFMMSLRLKKRLLDSKKVCEQTLDDKDFLDDHDGLQRKAQSQIDHWAQTAESLETECREKDVMPKHLPVVDFHRQGSGFDTLYKDDVDLEEIGPEHTFSGATGPKTLAHPRFPVLLSNPIHLLGQFPQTAQQYLRMAVSLPAHVPLKSKYVEDARRECGIQFLLTVTPPREAQKEHIAQPAPTQNGSRDNPRDALQQDKGPPHGTQVTLAELRSKDGPVVEWENKQDYINRWLLHKLRLSAMEAETLSATFRSFLKILNIERWQMDVLYFWARDEAAHDTHVEGQYGERSSLAVFLDEDVRKSESGMTERAAGQSAD
ncbi:uncharacterized protein BCR38DRAFT_404817 [Pseudomassariella vexata]|uniref:Uncharacterized protein n=1 Tax=Pseudomassariella vexata TaxID=1141098 RepID=A0A1Y2ELP5_9PEZI|nr:uncharacterized protein BCR38DRAFT_404817 [Pseudomassariella vexata]ORY71775.1 hypothetical protein BCR38DRAFT_404817 [Pseudomassariella vexata]